MSNGVIKSVKFYLKAEISVGDKYFILNSDDQHKF